MLGSVTDAQFDVMPDSGGGWRNGRGDDTMTMLRGYAHMVDFFTMFEWWKTEPHDELVHYIRDLYSINTIMLLDGNWSDHPGAARAA